jgi:hypothetical protein
MSSMMSSQLLSKSRLAVAWLQALVLLTALAGSAQATPVDVFFNGIQSGSTAYGIGLAAATNARDNFGVQIIDQVDLLTSWSSRLSVIQPPSSQLEMTPSPPTSTSLNRVVSNWQIENISGGTLAGASYLLFTNTGPQTVGSTQIDYPDANVGLRIDKDLGWAIVRSRDALNNDYYYPALLLDRTAATPIEGNLSPGERVTAAIHYVTTVPLTSVRVNGTTTYVVPKLNLQYALVPEPGTALLLGFGLSLLATRRKRA